MGTRGWRSTEFWFSLVAVVLGALMASGIFADDSAWAKIVGLGVSALAAMGYTASRTAFKRTKIQADSLLKKDLVDPS